MAGETTRRGPIEGEHVIGVDSDPSRRPGVPKYGRAADDVRSDAPLRQQQHGREHKLTRAAVDWPTPVFGSAQPPHGLSGAMREAAYRIPEHEARHWMLLLAADRVDSLGHRVKRNPLPWLAGGLLGFWAVKRMMD